jgi:signal transduction histidine kinase
VLAALGTAGALLLLFQTLALLRGYASAAERRVSELEAFAGRVSHDLRSPLQTIQLAVTSIERKAQDEALQRLATRASASVRRLDAMIRDLLQFARSGAAAQQGGCADVSAVLLDVGDELQPIAERAGVKLTMAGAPGLHAQIAVRDNGIGIAPRISPRLFDPFFRGSTFSVTFPGAEPPGDSQPDVRTATQSAAEVAGSSSAVAGEPRPPLH